MQVTVNSRQTLFDIVIQVCGGLENVFSIALRNGLSITGDLYAGQQIEITPGDISQKRVASYLAARNIRPATALTSASESISPGGIGYMAIEIDFIVS